MGFWKSGKDTLQNGTVLGAAIGAMLVWGETIRGPVMDFFSGLIPVTWNWFGTATVSVIIVGAFALLGYIMDRY